jgi:cobaltochelatase CobS
MLAKTVSAKSDDYIVSDSNLRLLRACVESNSAVLLVGETGTGKTTLVREIAKEEGKTLIRVSVNGSMGVEEILGKWLVNKGTTVWQDGILTMAARAGHWVVMDEINAALPEILFTLHSLLDDDRKIILAEKDNEVVIPDANFRFFATMNPPEEYAGTKDMNKALMSRFTAVLNIEVLNDTQEMQLLMKKGADKDVAYKLVSLGKRLRNKKAKDEIFYFCSTRDLVQAVQLVGSGLDLKDAVIGAVINKMSRKEFELSKAEFSATVGSTTFTFPYKSIEEMVKLIRERDAELALVKADYEKRLLDAEALAKKEAVKEVGDEIRDDLLKKIAAIAKS